MTTLTDTIERLITEARHISAPFPVSPLVLVRVPGTGVVGAIKEVASRLTMDTATLLCAQMDFRDFTPLPVLKNGELVLATHSLHFLRVQLEAEAGNDLIVILDEATANGNTVPAGVLEQIAREAKRRVVAILVVTEEQREDALCAIAQGAGIMPALVPVRVVSTAETILDQFMEYARSCSMDSKVVAFLEHQGGFGDATPHAWTRLAWMRSNKDFQAYDARTRAILAEGMLGADASNAFHAWLADQD